MGAEAYEMTPEVPMKVELNNPEPYVAKLCYSSPLVGSAAISRHGPAQPTGAPAPAASIAKLVQRDGELVASLEQAPLSLPWAPDQVGAMSPVPPPAEARGTTAPSRGSLGHPELCHRPCVFISAYRTPCQHGADCDYCHLPHPDRGRSLDKRQRDYLRRLGEADLLAVLLPHFRTKLRTGKVPLAASDLIGYLERRQTEFASRRLSANREAEPENLATVLDQMSFSWLLSLLPFSKEPEVVLELQKVLAAYAAGWPNLPPGLDVDTAYGLV
eukprot:s630_g1.t1